MNINVTVKNGKSVKTVTANAGSTVAEIIGVANEHIDMPCGGRGTCRKCRVLASGGISPYTDDEISALGADLEKGLRLACLAHVTSDAVIELISQSTEFDTAVSDGIIAATADMPLYKNYGVAIDIGTTTLAAKLCFEGRALFSLTAKNPQTAFGADVISRIELSLNGKSAELACAIRDGINKLICSLCEMAKISNTQIDAAVITGNTAMLYLLCGHSPRTLAAAPFEADRLFGEYVNAADIGVTLANGAQVYLPMCIGAFVGADITTALLASSVTSSDNTTLLCDIGTNGELALWHKGELLCCSTAAGPAFEGAGIVCGMHGVAGTIDHVSAIDNDINFTVIGSGEPKGICGSAVIDATAAMLTLSALDETGRITPEDCVCAHKITERDGDLFFEINSGIGIYGKDIRAVQLAKSAICAGIQTLVQYAGINYSRVERLVIAGGFGSYINLDRAADIGLIPAELAPKAQSAGNAALSGAVMLLHDTQLIKYAEHTAKNAKVYDLGASKAFMENYTNGMWF